MIHSHIHKNPVEHCPACNYKNRNNPAEETESTSDQISAYIKENPLIVGGVAVATLAGLGFWVFKGKDTPKIERKDDEVSQSSEDSSAQAPVEEKLDIPPQDWANVGVLNRLRVSNKNVDIFGYRRPTAKNQTEDSVGELDVLFFSGVTPGLAPYIGLARDLTNRFDTYPTFLGAGRGWVSEISEVKLLKDRKGNRELILQVFDAHGTEPFKDFTNRIFTEDVKNAMSIAASNVVTRVSEYWTEREKSAISKNPTKFGSDPLEAAAPNYSTFSKNREDIKNTLNPVEIQRICANTFWVLIQDAFIRDTNPKRKDNKAIQIKVIDACNRIASDLGYPKGAENTRIRSYASVLVDVFLDGAFCCEVPSKNRVYVDSPATAKNTPIDMNTQQSNRSKAIQANKDSGFVAGAVFYKKIN